MRRYVGGWNRVRRSRPVGSAFSAFSAASMSYAVRSRTDDGKSACPYRSAVRNGMALTWSGSGMVCRISASSRNTCPASASDVNR